MSTTAFISVQCIHTHQFTQFNKVSNTVRFIQFRIHFIYITRYSQIAPEFFFQLLDFCNGLLSILLHFVPYRIYPT